MNTKSRFVHAFLLMVLCSFQSCAVVGGIFKAGVWVGVLAVIVVLGIIIFIITKTTGKS